MPLAKSPNYLLVRRSGYYFRYALDPALRPYLGREIRRALGTAHLPTARHRAQVMAARVREFCAWAIRKRETELLSEDLKAALQRHLDASIQDIEGWVYDRPANLDDDPEEPDTTDDLLSEWEADNREKLTRNHLEPVAPEAMKLLEASGLQLEPDSTAFRALCREILKVRIRAYQHGRSVAREGFASAPLDTPAPAAPATSQPAVPAPAPSPSPSSPVGPRFSEAVTQYLRAKDGITEKSQKKYLATLSLWVEAMGDPVLCDATFNIDLIGLAREKLKKLPKNRGKGEKAGKSVDELITLGLEPVSYSTFRDWLVRLAEFTKWATQKRYLSFNPMPGEIPRKQRGRTARDERACFTDDQLRVLFDPANYLTRGHANAHFTPSQYWVPLLSLMTGARLAELTGLSVNDVEQDERGNWLLHIKENELGRTVKTEAGARAVPILSTLIAIGFPDYVDQVRRSGHRQLFPDVKPYNGDWSHRYSKWFGRYMQRIGLRTTEGTEDTSTVTFHSFRHTLVDRLTNAGIEPHQIKAIVGHEQSGETFKRYWKGFPPEVLAKLLEVLDYPIDWHGLDNGWRKAMAGVGAGPREAA